MAERQAARETAVGDLQLGLLGAFRLRRNQQPLVLSPGEQRVVAFLAVHDRPLQRAFVAGNLWIDSDDDHAGGNLRTAVWRLRQLDERLIESSRSHLALSPSVAVDLHQGVAHARRLLREHAADPDADGVIASAGDLLPDWYDDWVVVERERFRQLRLHALEARCTALGEVGAYGLAVEAGLACLAAEPLRESTHRAVIKVHLAEGNAAEAVRQYELCCTLFMRELGLSPSAEMQALVEELPVGEVVATTLRRTQARAGSARRRRRRAGLAPA
jgi:DNA-binding SARP family transcriptional activator